MRIRRLLASRVLPCKCLTGLYETHTDQVLTFIDAHDPTCRERGHREGARLAVEPLPATRPVQRAWSDLER